MAVQSASGVAGSARLVAAAPIVKKSPHPLASAFTRTWRNPLGMVGLGMMGLLIFAALFAPLISPYDPVA